MSFKLLLQSNTSEPNRLTKKLTLIQEVNVVLKASTSIPNPTFLLELSNSTIPTFNYVTCTDFGRSYFVRNVTSKGGNIWEIQCEVDVLSSFAKEIRANSAIVKRQENNWNLYFNDGSFRCYQNPRIITKSFPMGFTPNSSNFVLAVSGGVPDTTT